MTEQFYTILTKVGKAKIANSTALGTKLNLVKFQLGDGNGIYYNPTEDQDQLKNKVWEGNISSITVDKENPNWIIIQTLLPSSIGGFMVREAAVIDEDNDIIAIGKYPETYKPVAENGSTKDLVIKMILEISNSKSVTLKIDPTIILTTKKDLIDSQKNLEEKLDKKYMHINVYDKNNNSIVDIADNAKKLNGIDAEQYTKKEDLKELKEKVDGIKSVEHATNASVAELAGNSDKLGGKTDKEFVKYDDGAMYFTFYVDEDQGNDTCPNFPGDKHVFKTFFAATQHCKKVSNFFGTFCDIGLRTDAHADSVFLERTKVRIYGNDHTIKNETDTGTWYISEGYFEAKNVKIHCQQFNAKKSFVTMNKVTIIKTKYDYALFYATQSNIYLKECILQGIMNDTKSYSTGCYAEYGTALTIENVKIINCDAAIYSYASNVFLASTPTFENCGVKTHIGQGGNIFKTGKNEYE